ncbi:peptide chain release factor N(5)-glutamine methyltransferase [Bifidobacterium simiarum]|uniref:Release factor glutamine methyltransferase n=1 Tax=Bifidobacterium simiarum TaxID=2045441 RepID=A0A2M9HD14_9BIFI|nr:peptide chain release factor N(5)-glutamine methyltransferase [Bifidobacterium simiarum]PJM74704.1 protein-(glutamine-N5) methyltransferase, release factor-specific [Bifidobacterium simiarum]
MDLGSVLNAATRTLADAGVDTPRFDAKLLLAHAAGVELRDVDRAMLMRESLDFDESEFRAMIARRSAREPLQHITGHAPFRYLDLAVGPGVFIPRPETEIVVEAGFDWLKEQRIDHPGIDHPRIVDLCAGSGAIGLSAVTELADSEVWAVELSPETHQWTERNRKRILAANPDAESRYHLILGDATDPATLNDLDGTIDLVISNPPYVPESEVPEQPETRDHDPELALYGGSADGLLIPERIIDRSAGLLRHGGVLVMEHDISQGVALVDYAGRSGFDHARTGNDLTGRPRYLFAVRS